MRFKKCPGCKSVVDKIYKVQYTITGLGWFRENEASNMCEDCISEIGELDRMKDPVDYRDIKIIGEV